jgi:hypothetical protein
MNYPGYNVPPINLFLYLTHAFCHVRILAFLANVGRLYVSIVYERTLI